MIRNMAGTQRNRHPDGATQVQTHETDPGEPPKRLRAPGMHRVPSGDLLANAVEDLGGGGALCRRAENLRPIRDKCEFVCEGRFRRCLPGGVRGQRGEL